MLITISSIFFLCLSEFVAICMKYRCKNHRADVLYLKASRCCPGVDEPDSGAIRCRGTRIGYLPQTPGLDEERSAIDAVLHSDSLLARCVRQYEGAMASKDQKASSALPRLC